MTKEELQDLLNQVRDLASDYHYINFKAPKLKEEMQNVKRVPKDLRDEYDDALREIEYIENNL